MGLSAPAAGFEQVAFKTKAFLLGLLIPFSLLYSSSLFFSASLSHYLFGVVILEHFVNQRLFLVYFITPLFLRTDPNLLGFFGVRRRIVLF